MCLTVVKKREKKEEKCRGGKISSVIYLRSIKDFRQRIIIVKLTKVKKDNV